MLFISFVRSNIKGELAALKINGMNSKKLAQFATQENIAKRAAWLFRNGCIKIVVLYYKGELYM